MNAPEKYAIVRKIADGGMAEIFLARLEGARGFHKQVVLKRIRPALIADPQFRNMLIDEAHIAMGLNHGNIAQVLELGESGGRYFLAMELVDGWSLDQVVKRARKADLALPLELSLYVVVEVCRALSYAHNLTQKSVPMGIVHRDVSPQNVLLSDQGDVKLTDFGIAKARNKTEQTSIGVVKGKIAYMSPEQAAGAELDHRSDLFSLGIVLYSMVTGRLPFEGGTPLEVMVRIQAGEFQPPDKARPKLNSALTQLIMKAMALRPADRFQTAEAMLLAAERVLRNEFPPTGRTELKAFLDQLQQRDGVPPISRAPEQVSEITEKSQDPVEIGSSMTLTTPEPIRTPRRSGERPRTSGEKPRRRKGGQRKVMAVVAAVGAMLFLLVMLVPEPPSTPAPPAEAQASTTPLLPEAQVEAQPASTPPPAETVEAPPAPAAPEPAEAAEVTADAGAAATADAQDEDETQLLAEAVPDATSVVIGEEDSTSEPAAEAEAAPPDAGTAIAENAPKPPPERPAPPKVASAPPPPPKPAATASKPPQPAKRDPKDGTVSVLITSQPTGAVVKLKKRVFGKTPIPLRFKTGIIFELTFVKNGYAPTAKRFMVTTRKDQKVVAYLKAAPKKRR